MSTYRPMGVFRDDEEINTPDPYRDPAIQAAIKRREDAIQAEVESRRVAAAKAREDALAPVRAAEIERRIFAQVAVGGVRYGREQ